MNNREVIAITIGPIYDTMMLVSKPAGLWGASYLFSYISRRLTEEIQKCEGSSIITPYFDLGDKDNEMMKKGVGYYHDHILVRGIQIDAITTMIDNVKKEIGENIYKSLAEIKGDRINRDEVIDYVVDYLCIYAVKVEDNGENAIQSTSGYLNAIELQKTIIPNEKENYLAEFLDNDVIRNSFLVGKDNANWMLSYKDGRLKDICHIALSDKKAHSSQKEDYKRYRYYALVNSDGDRMGKLIEKMQDDEAIRAFSNQCMNYTTLACDLIIQFGGIVVYAGGDDLQFIVPLTHMDSDNRERTIFDLLYDITEAFKSVFINEKNKDDSEKPSVSFGVEITFNKYPLYEALAESFELLHKAKDKGRDSAVVRLMKHSGQTSEILIRQLGTRWGALKDAISDVMKYQISEDMDPLKSVISHISEASSVFETIFGQADSEKALQNYMENFFDNPGQKNWKDYLEDLKSLMKMSDAYEAQSDKEHDFPRAESVISMLRIIQFFGEKGKEEEDEQEPED